MVFALANVCVYVLLCSVWDALTDNYSSTWDGTDSEGLNGNLSELEVGVTPNLSISILFLSASGPLLSDFIF